MKKRLNAFRLLAPVLLCGVAGASAFGQAATIQPLLEKAHALELRGRMDMAAQTWTQVLLADPNNPEALGGLARAAKLSGNRVDAERYLGRLRVVSPNDPAIARIEATGTQVDTNARLRLAGRLAQQGQYGQAMDIYRQVYGTNPPPGDAALGYYETESATEEGRQPAIDGLRGLVAKNPGDSRYQIALGRLLTYNPKTRGEGRRLLLAHMLDPAAAEAYRQSLLFDVQNATVASEIRAYLERHNDPQLAEAYRTRGQVTAGTTPHLETALTPAQRAEATARRARLSADQEAYRSLNAHQLAEAERRFTAILEKNPKNADASAGMGYIRMQQENFGGALSFFSQARLDGSKDRGLDAAIATSRFWNTVGEGGIALKDEDVPLAEKNYRAALAMRPESPEALEALGGTLLKAGQPQAAEPYFAEYAKLQPGAAHAWRGLFLAQYGSGHVTEALETERRMPMPVNAELAKDPLYLSGLASAYSSAGRDVDAQRVLAHALELPFPADAEGVQLDTQLQYADILLAAHRVDQAASLYRQILSHDGKKTLAWEGLVRAEHARNADARAVQTIESMPAASYAQAMRDPGFDETVASIYETQHRYDVAGDLLEQSLARQVKAGQKPSVALQIQLAGIDLLRNVPKQAFPLYQQVLSANPGNTDAWKGLLSALHTTGRDEEALAQAQAIPVATRTQLENDPAYLQTIASMYSGLGQPRDAEMFLRRVQQNYAAQHALSPAAVDIQNAWLLYNLKDEQELYRELMTLGDRTDLTPAQRQTVQTIWTNLAIERSNQAADHGNFRKAQEILDATADAFPDNLEVPKLLSGGYARAGASKQALAIWKGQDMTTAPVADYRSAVGAALAAEDSKDAETWLRFALQQYPRDSDILTLAAQFEVARGDAGRAEQYYDAALDAMPEANPGTQLTGELGHPDATGRPAGSTRALAGLLQPEPAEANIAAPPEPARRPSMYLPGYGNSGLGAPVVLPPNMADPGEFREYRPQTMTPGITITPLPTGPGGSGVTQPVAPTRLRDYSPQARVREHVQTQRPVEYALEAEGSMPILIPAVFHQLAVVRITAEPQSLVEVQGAAASLRAVAWQQGSLQSSQQQGSPTAPGQTKPATAPGASPAAPTSPASPTSAPASPPSDVYGPYVPYVPPAVQPVQLGVSPSAQPSAQPEVTDVLPTAHYVPNAHGDVAPVEHPDVTAADAAATRRRGNRANRAGQSTPSEETIRTTPTDPVVYLPYSPDGQKGAQGGQPPRGQVAQPGFSPGSPEAGTGALPQGGSGVGSGQQYPQPNTGYRVAQPTYRTHRRSHTTATRRAAMAAPLPVAPAPEPVSSPLPAYQGMSYPGLQQPLTYQPYTMTGPSYPMGNPPSDYDLMQQRLPPLRGRSYTGNLAPQVPLSQRERTELALDQLEGSYSGWLGGTGSARYRSGTPGVDRLTDVEATFEASATVGEHIRLSIVPKAVFLNSGTLDTIDSLNPNPVLGTLPGDAANAPQQQSANGIGGEVQVSTRNFAGAVGYTPYEFLVRNVTARALFRVGRHFTLFGDRSPVVETQLSYAGLRDPGSVTPVYAGNIWGGVIATGGGVRFDTGNERAGFYLSAEGADLSGYHVLENTKFEASAGAYFLAHTFPGFGRLNIGASLFGMHFSHNERPLTYGLGGYFSPGAYLLASVPVTFAGRYQENFHYVVQGSIGVQTFQEDGQSYFPLDRGLQSAIVCTTLQVATGVCGRTPNNSNTGGNYSINAEGAYRIADHWYAGGFLAANNTNNYNTVTGGFFVRYLFRQQFATEEYPTGLFPVDGFRPLRVP